MLDSEQGNSFMAGRRGCWQEVAPGSPQSPSVLCIWLQSDWKMGVGQESTEARGSGQVHCISAKAPFSEHVS